MGEFNDTNRMPLPAREIGDLDKQPLACSVLEARLDKSKLHSTCRNWVLVIKMERCAIRPTTWVHQKLGQPCGPSRSDLAVDPLSKIDDTRPYNEPPTLIAKAMLRGIEGEGRDIIRVHRIADETAGRMRIQANHEKECQMMRIPESLKALSAYLVVSGCVHQEHEK